MLDISKIELKSVQELIPDVLYKKFENFDFVKLNEIINLKTDNFKEYPYVGSKVALLYNDFRKLVLNHPEEIIKVYQASLPKELPISYSKDVSFICLFETLVEDFLNIKLTSKFKSNKKEFQIKRDIDIIRKYFGLKSEVYETSKIALRHRFKSSERVRQIINKEFLVELKELFNGKTLEKWNCYCRPDFIELLKSIKNNIARDSILNELNHLIWFKNKGIEREYFQRVNYFLLLLRVWDYQKVKLSTYYYLTENTFYTTPAIKDELFLKIGTKIVLFLKNRVIPVALDDIIIEVIEEFRVNDDFIELTCNVISEIEKTNSNYQIKFENLSSINAYVYRLLYEKQQNLSYDELLHLINKRLVKDNKEITMESLKQTLRSDDFVSPIGKTGVWTLRESNSNTDSTIKLILKSFRILDKPLSVLELKEFIWKQFFRKDVTTKTISAYLSNNNYRSQFVKLKNNRFTLAESKYLHASEIIKTNKSLRKTRPSKNDRIADKAIEILKGQPENKMFLNELVKILTEFNGEYHRTEIYKALSQKHLIFKKEKYNSYKKYVSLIIIESNTKDTLISKYNWEELSKILQRELSPIFHSNEQRQYDIEINSALDVFFKIITIDISKSYKNYNDLPVRMLPSLFKFYNGRPDRNDKLNYLKQIVTTQESFFKKLLFLVNPIKFGNLYKNPKIGLGTMLNNLEKIDKSQNRYKKLRYASVHEFGKHCLRAYDNRNIDAHNAFEFTENQIIEITTSSLVLMVYASYEYYDEINKI